MPRREELTDGSVRIHFDAPIPFHDESRAFLTLRQPTVGEVWTHGDPLSLVFNDQAFTEYVDRAAMVLWIERLMTDHDAAIIGARSDTALALMIEDAVRDFFVKARRTLKASSAPSSAVDSRPSTPVA